MEYRVHPEEDDTEKIAATSVPKEWPRRKWRGTAASAFILLHYEEVSSKKNMRGYLLHLFALLLYEICARGFAKIVMMQVARPDGLTQTAYLQFLGDTHLDWYLQREKPYAIDFLFRTIKELENGTTPSVSYKQVLGAGQVTVQITHILEFSLQKFLKSLLKELYMLRLIDSNSVSAGCWRGRKPALTDTGITVRKELIQYMRLLPDEMFSETAATRRHLFAQAAGSVLLLQPGALESLRELPRQHVFPAIDRLPSFLNLAWCFHSAIRYYESNPSSRVPSPAALTPPMRTYGFTTPLTTASPDRRPTSKSQMTERAPESANGLRRALKRRTMRTAMADQQLVAGDGFLSI